MVFEIQPTSEARNNIKNLPQHTFFLIQEIELIGLTLKACLNKKIGLRCQIMITINTSRRALTKASNPVENLQQYIPFSSVGVGVKI